MLTIVVSNPLWYVQYAQTVNRPIRWHSEICWHVGEPKPTIIQPSKKVVEEAMMMDGLHMDVLPPQRKITEISVDGDEIASFLRLTTYTHGGGVRVVAGRAARDLYAEWMKYPS